MRPLSQMVSDCLRLSMSTTWHLGSEDKNFILQILWQKICWKQILVVLQDWWFLPKIVFNAPWKYSTRALNTFVLRVFKKYKPDYETFNRCGLWLSTTSHLGSLGEDVFWIHVPLIVNKTKTEMCAGNLFGFARLITAPTQDCVWITMKLF